MRFKKYISKNSFCKKYIPRKGLSLLQVLKTSYIPGGTSKAPKTKIYYAFPKINF